MVPPPGKKKGIVKIFREFPRPEPVARAPKTPLVPDAESFWLNVLQPATAEIEQGFMLLARADAPGVWRERVYAYELYHQMRRKWESWPGRHEYALNGEVDKRGQAPVADIVGKNPDFIVHKPGSHEQNLLILEVKTCEASGRALEKDVEKITRYMGHRLLKYQSGILLVAGDRPRRLARAIEAAEGTKIAVAVHREAGRPAELVT